MMAGGFNGILGNRKLQGKFQPSATPVNPVYSQRWHKIQVVIEMMEDLRRREAVWLNANV